MADHGDNYTRDEKSKGKLGQECGHHCGVITTGAHAHEGHCSCKECHNTAPITSDLPSEFTMGQGGMDLRSIK